jgi:hypothetical protein
LSRITNERSFFLDILFKQIVAFAKNNQNRWTIFRKYILMSELYFVRHGQASFGEKDYDRLSPTGIKQAQILARHMANTGKSFDAVYSGTLLRQKTTAIELINSYKASGRPIPEPIESGDFNEYDSFTVWKTQLPLLLNEEPSLSDELPKIHSRGSLKR